MAIFEAQLSSQVAQAQKDEIGRLLRTDLTHGTATEADEVRAALRLGLPLLAKMKPGERLKLFAAIRRGE
jgi:thiol:disulfide interchange protein